MTELPNDTESLKELIRQLLAEIAELRRRLGMDSTNSHQPPGSDGFKKKTTAPGLPKEDKKPNGGQTGHRGRTLKRVEQPDLITVHLPQNCTCCGRPFSTDEAHDIFQIRQVFDLPQPRLEVTEHRLARIECCGRAQEGTYPPAVTAAVQYGPGVRAWIVKLSVDHKMPMEQISQLFQDLYDYDLNSATVDDALARGYVLAAPVEAQVMAQLTEAELVHFDETGVRVAGKLRWMHVASTETLTHLFVHDKRGGEALHSEASVLKDFTGTAVHDCWAPYFTFPLVHHALCGAHLLRELKGLWDGGAVWAEEMHGFFLDLYKMPRPIADFTPYRLQYHEILKKADQEEPPPKPSRRGKSKQSKGRNLLDRLRKHEKGFLAFACESDIPFTNNQAERDVRPTKVKQKVSGCFRTMDGARAYARLQGAISTFRKQGLNVFATLRDLFSHEPVVLA